MATEETTNAVLAKAIERILLANSVRIFTADPSDLVFVAPTPYPPPAPSSAPSSTDGPPAGPASGAAFTVGKDNPILADFRSVLKHWAESDEETRRQFLEQVEAEALKGYDDQEQRGSAAAPPLPPLLSTMQRLRADSSLTAPQLSLLLQASLVLHLAACATCALQRFCHDFFETRILADFEALSSWQEDVRWDSRRRLSDDGSDGETASDEEGSETSTSSAPSSDDADAFDWIEKNQRAILPLIPLGARLMAESFELSLRRPDLLATRRGAHAILWGAKFGRDALEGFVSQDEIDWPLEPGSVAMFRDLASRLDGQCARLLDRCLPASSLERLSDPRTVPNLAMNCQVLTDTLSSLARWTLEAEMMADIATASAGGGGDGGGGGGGGCVGSMPWYPPARETVLRHSFCLILQAAEVFLLLDSLCTTGRYSETVPGPGCTPDAFAARWALPSGARLPPSLSSSRGLLAAYIAGGIVVDSICSDDASRAGTSVSVDGPIMEYWELIYHEPVSEFLSAQVDSSDYVVSGQALPDDYLAWLRPLELRYVPLLLLFVFELVDHPSLENLPKYFLSDVLELELRIDMSGESENEDEDDDGTSLPGSDDVAWDPWTWFLCLTQRLVYEGHVSIELHIAPLYKITQKLALYQILFHECRSRWPLLQWTAWLLHCVQRTPIGAAGTLSPLGAYLIRGSGFELGDGIGPHLVQSMPWYFDFLSGAPYLKKGQISAFSPPYCGLIWYMSGASMIAREALITRLTAKGYLGNPAIKGRIPDNPLGPINLPAEMIPAYLDATAAFFRIAAAAGDLDETSGLQPPRCVEVLKAIRPRIRDALAAAEAAYRAAAVPDSGVIGSGSGSGGGGRGGGGGSGKEVRKGSRAGSSSKAAGGGGAASHRVQPAWVVAETARAWLEVIQALESLISAANAEASGFMEQLRSMSEAGGAGPGGSASGPKSRRGGGRGFPIAARVQHRQLQEALEEWERTKRQVCKMLAGVARDARRNQPGLFSPDPQGGPSPPSTLMSRLAPFAPEVIEVGRLLVSEDPANWTQAVEKARRPGFELDMLNWYLDNAAPAVAITEYMMAKEGHVEGIRLLLETELSESDFVHPCTKQTPLQAATYSGKLAVLKAYKDHGVLPTAPAHAENGYCEPLLKLAVKGGHLPVLLWLIEEGVPADDEELEDYSLTPLMAASLYTKDSRVACAMIDALVRRGKAVIDAERDPLVEHEELSGDSVTAFFLACAMGNIEVVRLLRDLGADVAYRSAAGRTAVHYAAQFGRLDVVRYLVEECHVDVLARDKDNKTANQILIVASAGGGGLGLGEGVAAMPQKHEACAAYLEWAIGEARKKGKEGGKGSV